MFRVLLLSTWPQIQANNRNLRISDYNPGDYSEKHGPHLLSYCYPQAFSAFVSIFSKSQKSKNIKLHKAERKVCEHKGISNWLVITGWRATGWRSGKASTTTDYSQRPLPWSTLDFWSLAGNFREARTATVFLRPAHPLSSPPTLPKNILSKGFTLILTQG